MSNVFYAAYVTGKLVDGQLIKGRHPALIDLDTFLKANEIVNGAPTAGIAKTHRIEELPLKVFARDELSGIKLTGYIKKGNWYYKTRNTNGRNNVSANKLHQHFMSMLDVIAYNKKYKEQLKKKLTLKLREKMSNQLNENIQLKKRVSEIENQLEKMEERYVLGELDKALYLNHSAKLKQELADMNLEIHSKGLGSSNLDLIIEKGLRIAGNLRQL